MHSIISKDGSYVALHNGDFSGAVSIRKLDIAKDVVVYDRSKQLNWDEVTVPATFLFQVVADAVRTVKIGEIEQQTPEQILGITR